MNFVIFSPRFYPQNDPEAYCATRFASALSKRGHRVAVVTLACKDEDFERSYDVLLDRSIEITRIETKNRKSLYPHINFRWFTVLEDDSCNYGAYRRVLNSILKKYVNPILITRTHPIGAAIVGYYCRKNAYRWIAHFSDPIPWFQWTCRLVELQKTMLRFWLRRVFRSADLISITCERAKRFYQETLGTVAYDVKWVLAEHIGDFKLVKSENNNQRISMGTIAHFGAMYYGRGKQILMAVEQLNEEGFKCEFIQDREVKDATLREAFANCRHAFIASQEDSEVKDRAKRAQVSFVADFDSDLSYSPFLMSKFVYQIYEDKPLVVLAKKDSAKHDYCMRFPEAGLFYADMDDNASLKVAIKQAMRANLSEIDRRRIRKHFSDECVIDQFFEGVSALEVE